MLVKNMFIFIKNHTLFLSLFSIMQIFSILLIIISYCQYRESVLANKAYYKETATFSVDCSGVTFTEIEAYIDDICNEKAIAAKTVRVFLDFDFNSDVLYLPLGMDYIIGNGEGFSSDVTPQIIIPLVVLGEINSTVGEKIEINGQLFSVVGCYNVNEYSAVNRAAIKAADKVLKIEVAANSLPTKKEIEKFNEHTYSFLPFSTISNPRERNITSEFGFNSDYINSIILLLLAIINISYVYNYILRQRKYILTIYRSCGCSLKRMFVLCFSEFLMYFIITAVLAIFIFHFFIKKTLFSEAVSPLDYIPPIMTAVVIVLAVIIPQINNFIKKSLIDVLKRGELI
ncbi:MAG: FtsX-like permease family protein [Firmicutes bacterium ADurb.Bin300]|nr:MAG: FtsX-like permease family protein [Firmicutes bacterium ADurb.Bin300]